MSNDIFDQATYPAVGPLCLTSASHGSHAGKGDVQEPDSQADSQLWFNAREIDAYITLESRSSLPTQPSNMPGSRRETAPSASSSMKTGTLQGTVPSCVGPDDRMFALEYDQVLQNYLRRDSRPRPESLTEHDTGLSTSKLGHPELAAILIGGEQRFRPDMRSASTSKVHDGVVNGSAHPYRVVPAQAGMTGSFPSPQYNGDTHCVQPIGNPCKCRQSHIENSP